MDVRECTSEFRGALDPLAFQSGTPPGCGAFLRNRWCRSCLAQPPATRFHPSGIYRSFRDLPIALGSTVAWGVPSLRDLPGGLPSLQTPPPRVGSPFRGSGRRDVARPGLRPPALLLRSAERTLRVPLARERFVPQLRDYLRFAPVDSRSGLRSRPQGRSCERRYDRVLTNAATKSWQAAPPHTFLRTWLRLRAGNSRARN
jgi:hypothetical protein